MTEEKKEETEKQEGKDADFANLDVDELRELAREFRKQKSSANREAQKAKQEAEKRVLELEQKVKEYSDKDKSELEKLAAERDALKAEYAKAQAKLAHEHRIGVAARAGCSDPEYMAFALERAQNEDADLDVQEWIESFKGQHAGIFGGESQASKPGASKAGGPAPAGNKKADVLLELKDIETEIARLRGDRFVRDRDARMFDLTLKKAALIKKMRAT